MTVTKVVYPVVNPDGTIPGQEGTVITQPFTRVEHNMHDLTTAVSIGTGIRADGSVEIISAHLSHQEVVFAGQNTSVVGGVYQEFNNQ